MGNPISKLREETRNADEKTRREVEERLQILERVVDGKLSQAKQEILVGGTDDQGICSGQVVARHQQINIIKSTAESQKLRHALHRYFQRDFIGGLEQIVQVGGEPVLGNTSVGEFETTDTFIVWSHSSLLRCDAYYYRWNFSSKGIIEDVEGVLGVYVVKRIIDLTKTHPEVLAHTITQMADRIFQSFGKSSLLGGS